MALRRTRRVFAALLAVSAIAASARTAKTASTIASSSAVKDAGAEAVGPVEEESPDAASPRLTDDAWERGRSTRPEPRPRPIGPSACSTRVPICVHSTHDFRDELRVMAVLHSAENAYAMVEGGLRLPAPRADFVTGALDVYLIDGDGDDDARVRLSERDPLASFDRASAFIELPRVLEGCARDSAIQRAMIGASLLGAAPAASEGLSLASAEHMTRLAVPCATGLLDAVAAFQRQPTRNPFDAGDDAEGRRFARGAAMLFDWADLRFGAEPGGMVRASWALVPTETPPYAETFSARPDLFEVLRKSWKGVISVGTSLDELFFRFAGARAGLGLSADEMSLPSSRAWGDAARIHTDFAIDWPVTARRFLSPKPVAPLGASYIAIARRGAAPGTRLRVEAEWEQHARFRWMAIKVDASGKPLATIFVPSTPRATEAQATIADLDGADGVLLVAYNAGDVDREFDPDDGVWEPHAFLVTVASE